MREIIPAAPKLLSGLRPEQSRLILQSAERRRFAANQVIVTSGAPATDLFQMTKGMAKVSRVTRKGDEVLLWWVAAGDTFGIGALLAPQTRYIGTAEAVADCEFLVWNRDRIRKLAATYKRLTENALHIVLYYLAAYADRLVGVMTETAEQRLAQTLVQLSNRAGNVRSGGIELSITNENLGRLAHVSVFTASRLLKKWERLGLIEKSRGKIRILSPEGLLSD